MSQPSQNAVDISTIPIPQLSQLQQRLQSDLEHLSTSHARLRAAQSRFKDCIRSIQNGVQTPPPPALAGTSTSASALTPTDPNPQTPSNQQQKPKKQLLIPLTTSLYIPAHLASPDTVLVDIGTGFYIEKSTTDAVKFYEGKIGDLNRNMSEIEKVVGGKTESLRGVEDVLRGKVLAQQQQQQQAGGAGGGQGQGQLGGVAGKG